MPRTEFDALPDDARLWVFASSEPVLGAQAERLLAHVDGFLDQWNAHGHPLLAARRWVDDRFLLVAVDERSAPPSGCSIDAMVRVLKELETELGCRLADHAHVIWRDADGAVQTTERPAFARLAASGAVSPDTHVFDTTLTRVEDVRAGRLEVPAREAWHRRAFWRTAGGAVAVLAMLGSLFTGAAPAAAQIGTDANFVTTIGNDTLAVESVRFTDEGVEAEVLLRSPAVTWARYLYRTDADGAFEGYEARVWPLADREGEPSRTERVAQGEDGTWTWTLITAQGEQSRPVEFAPEAVPFVDQLHWFFDVALQRRARSGQPLTGDMPMFTGSRAMTYGVVDGERGLGLRHPTRGVSAITVSDAGELLTLDGYGTTRAITVTRVAALDMPALSERFGELGPMGELSGRGEAEVTVGDATFVLDFGTPRKRGREIFGTLVAYDEVWRTGANTASHITFDRTVVFGGELEVPAGTYTLFSIPAEDGATLIFNTLTGINGQNHDPDADFGRVAMRREALDESLEVFTISVRDTPTGGVLELLWDRTAYRVDFTVR